MMAAFESRARTRTWIAVLAAAGIVLATGWAPAVGGAVLLGAFLWVQLALVRPAARLLSVRRRIVATWTFRLLAASFSAIGVALVELLTVIPVIGVVGKTAAAAIHVAVLAGIARKYMAWQTRRESRGTPVNWREYALLVFAALSIVVGATVAFWAAFWVVVKVSTVVAQVDPLAAAGPSLGVESLEWASTIGLGAATGTRASLFLVISGVLSHLMPTLVPQQLHFVGSPIGLGIALGLVVIESATERDDDLQTTFGLAAGGARIGASALLGVLGSGQPPSSAAAMLAGALGAGLAVAATAARHWLHSALRQLETEAFSPRRWLNRLEEGGVAGIAVAVYAGPMLAAAFVVVGLCAMLIASAVARSVEGKWRRPCPGCGAAIRVEASGCP